MTDPQEAKRTLMELRDKHGLTNEEFIRMHHFYPKKRIGIDRWLRYCDKTGRFREGESNDVLGDRLKGELDRRRSGPI